MLGNGKDKLDLPFNGWLPRPHQQKLWEYLQSGGKRAMAVWHRRAGKDEVCLHHIDARGEQAYRKLLALLAGI